MNQKAIKNRPFKAIDQLESLKKMWEIRIFEEMIQELFDAGELYGTMHLCIGQEATAVGGAGILDQRDWIVSTHRNHGHCIAKGTDIRSMFAEILGKKTGTNEGKGGSMHIADLDVGNLGSNGIVGAGFPIAAGAALSAQMQGSYQVVLCYAGDGATNEGSFHEALNLASIWQLPVIYFIENNQYGMSSSIEQMVNIKKLSDRSESYGIEGITIDGNDLAAVSETVSKAVSKARSGGGPTLIEALTYRHKGHSKSDKLMYRSEEECREWQVNNDPILRLEKELIQNKRIKEEEIRQLEMAIRKEMDDLVTSVKLDCEPMIEDLWTHVYAEDEV
ncbi:acetoin:2,6-dichlorophenolindophenol oxidoreductase subunit alpha [Enterococcus sp. DIV0840]|uniref:thiamine pyrophosphate-dependent dehydrogenase E1 component subunit alpha n=1 Tax=Enterococcus TaxID=1350 RepID=UPI001A8C2183|nr:MULTISPECIES: thiamine pyrophosphate-dependent dehydrogenase E1 component subunit alpha [Enterococcus]MBO0433754.1 thiamine pyrophosphate-dependent dehydrogenase E1 component subunit alpha [Enterococcus sp. DIV0849a]MBO0472828.1 thiamine pyrophosphate-dependent dehydrogenase E1 component subunit alpha [Enterococcus ureasiticus]